MMDSRVVDITGKRIGNLTVVRYAGSFKQRSHWICKCDCGTVWKVASNNLGRSKTSSCGRCRQLSVEEAMSRRIYADYKNRASKKGIYFSITFEMFVQYLTAPCAYCGSEKTNTKRVRKKLFKYNGIDRVDSDRGYFTGNIVPCCKICNVMKLDLEEKKFLTHINKIAEFTKNYELRFSFSETGSSHLVCAIKE